MQFIQELTPLQQAGLGVMGALLLVLLLTSIRRRRSVAVVGDQSNVASAPKSRRFGRRGPDAGLPRRQRRKLAAKAARSMRSGTPTTSVAEPPDPVDDIVVPPVPSTDAPAAVIDAAAVPAPPPAPRAVVVDDPYVGDSAANSPADATPVEGPEAEAVRDPVVADPGWPAPGELSAGFDPDAFDPLPEVGEDGEDANEQPTGIIDVSSIVDEALSIDVDADFDPATGWNAGDVAATGRDEPMIDQDVTAASAGDLDHVWGESGDDADQWEDPEEVDRADSQIAVEALADADALEDGTADFWAYVEQEEEPAAVAVEITREEIEHFDPADLVAESTSFHDSAAHPFSAGPAVDPGGNPLGGIALAAAAGAGPVVLDIASLAASGQPIELLIEPNGDGKGVRLRIVTPAEAGPHTEGSSGGQPSERPDAVEETGGSEPALDASAHDDGDGFQVPGDGDDAPVLPADGWEAVQDDAAEMSDVPFLTGGPPTHGPEAAGIASANVPAPEQPVRPERPGPDGDFTVVEAAAVAEAAEGLPVDDEGDPDDDPSRILEDIRARLAALDAQRDTRAV